METLPDHEMELDHRFTPSSGLEVQFVWNSLLSLAYSKVHDHHTGEMFHAIAPDGTHPKETFTHPFAFRIEQQAYTPEPVNYGLTGKGRRQEQEDAA